MDLQVPEGIPQRCRLISHPARGRKVTAAHRPAFKPEIHGREYIPRDSQRWVFVPDVLTDLPALFAELRGFEVLWPPPDFEGGSEFFASPVA